MLYIIGMGDAKDVIWNVEKKRLKIILTNGDTITKHGKDAITLFNQINYGSDSIEIKGNENG